MLIAVKPTSIDHNGRIPSSDSSVSVDVSIISWETSVKLPDKSPISTE
jgi:hypothetical protein